MTSSIEASPDRLSAVAALVDAARAMPSNLGTLLREAFPGLATSPEKLAESTRSFSGESSPAGLGGDGVAVWHDVGLFAVSSVDPPSLSLDNAEGLSMAPVPGGPYWLRLAPVEQGRLHTFRFGVNGEWGSGGDFAGYTEKSY